MFGKSAPQFRRLHATRGTPHPISRALATPFDRLSNASISEYGVLQLVLSAHRLSHLPLLQQNPFAGQHVVYASHLPRQSLISILVSHSSSLFPTSKDCMKLCIYLVIFETSCPASLPFEPSLAIVKCLIKILSECEIRRGVSRGGAPRRVQDSRGGQGGHRGGGGGCSGGPPLGEDKYTIMPAIYSFIHV